MPRPLHFAFGVLAALVASASDARGADVDVRMEGERIWVTARNAPAPAVFSRLAEVTGVRFILDEGLEAGPVSIEIEGLDVERTVANVLASLPKAAGHSMSYRRNEAGDPVLDEVKIFGDGAGGTARVYAAPTPSVPFRFPTPDLEERLEKMVEAGVPRETARKVIDLTREVQELQTRPEPGSYSRNDLSEEAEEQLESLIERGVPEDRAIQMLLLQDRYRSTIEELSEVAESLRTPTPAP